MSTYLRTAGSAFTVAILLISTVYAQRPTIPEWLAQTGQSQTRRTTVPSGPSPTLTDLIDQTDTVIRGVVGEPRSYLSDDQRDVYTDYPISRAIFIHRADVATTARPGLPEDTTVTLHGGTVSVGDLTYTHVDEALPSLPTGTECLFLLKHINGNRYQLAGMVYGAFAIRNGVLKPLTRRENTAHEILGLRTDEAVRQILTRLTAHRQ